ADPERTPASSQGQHPDGSLRELARELYPAPSGRSSFRTGRQRGHACQTLGSFVRRYAATLRERIAGATNGLARGDARFDRGKKPRLTPRPRLPPMDDRGSRRRGRYFALSSGGAFHSLCRGAAYGVFDPLAASIGRTVAGKDVARR